MSRFFLAACSCVCLAILVQTGADNSGNGVVVTLTPGQHLRGFQGTSAEGDVVYTFYGIPYAAPPLGEMRFKPPATAPVWSGTRDATKKSSICVQVSLASNSPQGSEDCLYLNIFSPNLNGSLPVFLWIHGGAFRAGSAFNDGDGATFAPKGIVAVTINYRLGAFGFLSTADNVLPGNYGMLDQVLALQWVQKNINAFGGDPRQVTIGGQSAGSVSVSLLIVSPLTEGLFQRAVLESGSSFTMGAVTNPSEDVNFKESTLQSARLVGCEQTLSTEVLECLQRVNAYQLFNASEQLYIGPRVESTYGFLPNDPTRLINEGKYHKADTLQGKSLGEFSWKAQDLKSEGTTRREFEFLLRSFLSIGVKNNLQNLVHDFMEVYIGNETDESMINAALIQASSDILFGGGTLVEINTFVKDSSSTLKKHFLYEFDYRLNDATSELSQDVDPAVEEIFVFYPDRRHNYTTEDRAVAKAVQTYWANFIKYGDPTPANNLESASLVKWDPFTETNPNRLKIDSVSKLVPFSKPELISLYEGALKLSKLDTDKTIVG